MPLALLETPHCLCGPSLPCRVLETLQEIAEILTKGVVQRRVFCDILAVLERGLQMRHGTIMLLTADGRELVVEATSTASGHIRTEARYRRGEGITGEVLETGRPRTVRNVEDEPKFKGLIYSRDSKARGGISFVCVPIVLAQETVGTLAVDLLITERANTLEMSENVLRIVASMIAHDASARRLAQAQRAAFEDENRRLREALVERYRPENMIGNSDEMRTVFAHIERVAQTDTTVLIRGESGTGKELAAAAIHFASPRRDHPFVKVNCAALSENLLESELFGHEKGAFTGALRARDGRIAEAEHGTLFLDEIGDFSPAVQVKLLRVLQEREYERVGSSTTRRADVRILTATNRNLEDAVRTGDFRADLYYRINVFALCIPPLRHRKTDILLLANHFVVRAAKTMGKEVRRISTQAIGMLMAYHWPGNVRELQNCIEHAVLMVDGEVIHGHALPPTLQMPENSVSSTASGSTLKDRVQLLERECIIEALKRSGGNVTAAARELGITSRMVRYKIDKLAIDEDLYRKRRRRKTRGRNR